MFRGKTRLRLMMLIPAALTAAGGCSNDSERVAEVALEATKRQAALDLDDSAQPGSGRRHPPAGRSPG